MSYSELICRSNYSFLRGASHPEEIISQASQLGLSAVAITDRNGVYGIPKAFWACKQHPQLKLISGCEVVMKHLSVFLLAKDRVGYGLMCRLLTAAHADKPKGEALLTLEELRTIYSPQSQNLFCLVRSTDCLKIQAQVKPELLHLNFLSELKEIFQDHFFLALSHHMDGFDSLRDQGTRDLAHQIRVSIAACNDVHYHVKERGPLQDALSCVREGTHLTEAGFQLFSNHERYLKSEDQMKELFRDFPEALANTAHIAEACIFSPSELRYRYPSEWIPSHHTAFSYLEELVWKGAQVRYSIIPQEVKSQILHELGLIQQLHFADYFLTIYDIIEFARSKDILCQGRGSAANSVICYVLGITAIDPVRMNLLFERFLSVERGEPPDIDVDFEHERREEVIQYIYNKYGRHRAAMVSAVVTYRRRSSLREISKAIGISVGTLSAKNLEKQFDHLLTESPLQNCSNARELVDAFVEELRGFPRHLSIHSGGFTLSADPIIEIVPVEPARMEARSIIQWDKYDLDYLGLLKIDILALGMLTAINKTLKLTGLKFHEIPPEDKATYKMIQKCDTVGVFQIESRAQMSMLGRLQPRSFYDLVIEVAIVRPGPIVGKMVHPYLRRRRGLEAIQYYHPKLKNILGKTLGVPMFQEQVMKMAIELADFTPGESDQLRRAIGAWRASGSIEKVGKRLLDGLLRNGIPPHFAQEIFEYMKGFSQYGFPESHAASFALIAYASSYLKCHYPAQFICSILNSLPMGFYAAHSLIDDVKRKGVTVSPIDPNHSHWDCTIEGSSLRLGFRCIRGFQQRDFDNLMAHRPYKDLDHFLSANRQIRIDVLQRLAMGGVFEVFEADRRQVLWKSLHRLPFRSAPQLGGQMPLGFGLQLSPPQETTQAFKGLSEYELFCEDYAAFDLSVRGHPMQALRKLISLPTTHTAQARSSPPNTVLETSGLLIIRQRPPTAKGTTFGTLEDEKGFLDLIIRKEIRDQFDAVFHDHCFLKVKGKIQRDGHSISMVVSQIKPIFQEIETQPPDLVIEPTQYYW